MQADLKPSVTETRPNVLANKILYNMLIFVFLLSVVPSFSWKENLL